MSLEENTLWDSGVFNSWFNDMESIIIKIVVDNALSNSEVLVSIFNYWFLEISIELKDLSVVFEPLRSNCRNGVVDLWLTSRYTLKSTRHALTHRSKELWINIFLEVNSLLANGAIFDAEKLSLVVARDRGISVSVSREEW